MYIVRYEKHLRDKHGKRVEALFRAVPLLPFGLIKIDADEPERKGLLAHEIEHYKQHLMTLTLHPILYNISKKYRLWSEIRAYKKQIELSEDGLEEAFLYAVLIEATYDVGVESIEIYKRLVDA